jgi:hypothetical protein
MPLTPAEVDRITLTKQPHLVVIGKPVTPSQASEIIRRTDTIFANDSLRRSVEPPEYETKLRQAFGFPTAVAKSDQFDSAAAERFRDAWGCVDAGYLANSSTLGSGSWCHPDGTICLVEPSGRYPVAREYFDACFSITDAFPFLDISVLLFSGTPLVQMPCVEVKGQDGTVSTFQPGWDVDTLPPHPWSAEMLGHFGSPVLGFRIRGGEVLACEGNDPALFDTLAQTLAMALEAAVAGHRRQRSLLTWHSRWGKRRSRGIDDELPLAWLRLAQSLGLARH